MKDHERIVADLALYAAGQLPAAAREAVATHLASCGECRNDLALWEAAAREIRVAGNGVAAPPTLAERALVAACADRSALGAALRAWRLLCAQALLVRVELFPASAAVMAIGVMAALLAGRAQVFSFFAPMIAAAGMAVIYGRERDPAAELVLSAPTSAWKILLARLTLVAGYDLLLALAASLLLAMSIPAGLVETIILGWLGPLTFLSALALLLSMWIGTGSALLVSYSLWMSEWIPYRSIMGSAPLPWNRFMSAYHSFWSSPVLLVALSCLLTIAALRSAGRVLRPALQEVQ